MMKSVLTIAASAMILPLLQGCCTTGTHCCHRGHADHCDYGMGWPEGPQAVPAGGTEVTVTHTMAPAGYGPIYFPFDSAELDGTARAELDRVHGRVGGTAEYVILEGHASSEGTDAYNLGLSQRRAESVKGYLVSKGVALERISTTPQGEERPAVPNTSESNRSLNRRVVIHIQSR